jgi:hypothetical protein
MGIIDRDGGIINEEGFTFEEINYFSKRDVMVEWLKHDSFC